MLGTLIKTRTTNHNEPADVPAAGVLLAVILGAAVWLSLGVYLLH